MGRYKNSTAHAVCHQCPCTLSGQIQKQYRPQCLSPMSVYTQWADTETVPPTLFVTNVRVHSINTYPCTLFVTNVSVHSFRPAESCTLKKGKLAESCTLPPESCTMPPESCILTKGKLAESCTMTKGKLAESCTMTKGKLAESCTMTKGKLAESYK